MRGMPGGRPPISDEMRQFALMMLGAILVLFFLLVIRVEWDKRHNADEPDIRTMTNPALLRSKVLGRRSNTNRYSPDDISR